MTWIEAFLNAQGKGRQRFRQRIEHRNGRAQRIRRTHERCVPATVRGNGGAHSISATIDHLRIDRDPQQTTLPVKEVLGIEVPSEINCDCQGLGRVQQRCATPRARDRRRRRAHREYPARKPASPGRQ